MKNEPKAPRAIKIITLVTIAVVAMAVFGMVTVLRWAYQSTNVLQVVNPVTIQTKTVKEDGIVVVDFKYCKTSGVSGQVTWKLVSKRTEILLPAYTDTTPKGCKDSLVFPILLPLQAAPDTYHLEWIVTYRLNPLKNVTNNFKSEDFTITP